MYDIRQFKPTLYILLIIGMIGFALAAETPGVGILSVAASLANAWLVHGGRFRPLHHIVSGFLTLLALGWFVLQLRTGGITPIIVIGQFLVVLQIVKLFEQRANRDYAQLLVLSLLLMVAASINTASLIFGVLLIGYLFLSLYCCLLFHLKVEADHAAATFVVPADRVNPATLRQDQRYLPRSMRRISLLVSSVAIVMAVVVFILFPRGPGAGLMGQWQFRPAQAMTGFSEQQVGLDQIASIIQNPQPVAYVQLWKDDVLVPGTQTLLLRGATLDIYNGADATRGGAWRWSHTRSSIVSMVLEPGTLVPLPRSTTSRGLRAPDPPGPRFRQHVTLLPTGGNTLFAMPGLLSFIPTHEMKIHYNPSDQTLRTIDRMMQAVEYEVICRDTMDETTPPPASTVDPEYIANIDPQIAAYARRPEVTGGLAVQRPPADEPQPIDEEIARRIEQHLYSTFGYTLDLTAESRDRNEDPVVAFLYRYKRGHCQYFASAMTLLCQSLHLQARTVIGFKVDPNAYNAFGGYYLVRQSDAHQWVEVLTPGGWKTFDPTSAQGRVSAGISAWQKVRNFFNFLEFTWATSVVAYNQETRENVIQTANNKVTQWAFRQHQAVGGLNSWWQDVKWPLSKALLRGFEGLLILFSFGFVLWLIIRRIRLRRRAARMGIDFLPTPAQLRLVRQLRFYDELLRLLEHHHITRPTHLTPLEFSHSLSFLPAETYNTIRRLTGLFYRIRYGGAQLQTGQQRRLASVIDKIAPTLPQSITTPL